MCKVQRIMNTDVLFHLLNTRFSQDHWKHVKRSKIKSQRKRQTKKIKCTKHWLRMNLRSPKLFEFENCWLLLTVWTVWTIRQMVIFWIIQIVKSCDAGTRNEKMQLDKGNEPFSFLFSYVIFATFFRCSAIDWMQKHHIQWLQPPSTEIFMLEETHNEQ